ncbi:MAG: helix-turn-helix domain-containing protein [Gemmatimonadota bacterium]
MSPPATGPDRGSLHVDLSGVSSVRVQEEVRERLARWGGIPVRERVGAWEAPSWVHHPGPGVAANPALLMADFSRIAERVTPASLAAWRTAARRRPIRVVGLVDSERDAPQLVQVPRVMHAMHGRLSLVPEPRYSIFGVRRPGNTLDVDDLLFLLAPEALLEARFLGHPNRILLRFGDDLTVAIRPEALGLGARLGQLLLDSATPSPDGRSLHITEVSLTGGPTREHQGVALDSKTVRRIAEDTAAEGPVLDVMATPESLPDEDPVPFGVRLKTARTGAGLTQKELGSRSGMDQSVISNLERGIHEPRLATIKRLAEGLGLSSAVLLTGSGAGKTDPPERTTHDLVEASGADGLEATEEPPKEAVPKEAVPEEAVPEEAAPERVERDPGQPTRTRRRPLERAISDLELPPPLGDRPRRR